MAAHMHWATITPLPSPAHALQARAWAQPENCVAGFTNTNTACRALTSRVDACAALAADGRKPVEENAEFASCFCRQDLFSNLVLCKGVHRECILDYAYDADFDRYQSQWLGYCATAAPQLSAITTPPLASVTVPRASNACDYIHTACDRYQRYTDLCATSYASNTVNCRCQPQIQYVESICAVDGGALCPTAANSASASTEHVELTDLWGYKSCKTWLGIPGSLVSGSMYSRAPAATPTLTNVPFVDFPLTYFSVPTDPPFVTATGLSVTSVQGGRGTRLTLKAWIAGLSMSVAIGGQFVWGAPV